MCNCALGVQKPLSLTHVSQIEVINVYKILLDKKFIVENEKRVMTNITIYLSVIINT